jgi:hypothetical protein
LKTRLIRLTVAFTLAIAPLSGAVAAHAANGPAPGTGATGACNMLADPTMGSVPMAHDAPQGNAGMFHAVAVSGC